MAECRFFGECRLAGGLSPRICHGNGTITTISAVGYVNGRCGRFTPVPDGKALLALADELDKKAERITMAAQNAQFTGSGPTMEEAKHDANQWRSISHRIRKACGEAKA